MCLLGLRDIAALQPRVGRKQHSSWVPNCLLQGRRASVASMAPEIPPATCAPLSVGIKVRPVLSVSQRDERGVLELVQRHRPLSHFGQRACPLLLSCSLGAPAQSWGRVCPSLEPLSATSTSHLLHPRGLAAPRPRQQQRSSSGMLFLTFPPIWEAGCGWEPAHLQSLRHSLAKLQVVPRGFPPIEHPFAGPTLEPPLP